MANKTGISIIVSSFVLRIEALAVGHSPGVYQNQWIWDVGGAARRPRENVELLGSLLFISQPSGSDLGSQKIINFGLSV